MDNYQDDTYGEHIAGTCDEWYSNYEDATITTLKELAHGGRALELGIGTGRVALPLLQPGIEVHGFDASEPMGRLVQGGLYGGRRHPYLGLPESRVESTYGDRRRMSSYPPLMVCDEKAGLWPTASGKEGHK